MSIRFSTALTLLNVHAAQDLHSLHPGQPREFAAATNLVPTGGLGVSEKPFPFHRGQESNSTRSRMGGIVMSCRVFPTLSIDGFVSRLFAPTTYTRGPGFFGFEQTRVNSS